jgi:hypothetical protein
MKEWTKIVLFILTFIGIIIILKYIKGENGTEDEMLNAVKGLNNQVGEMNKTVNAISNEVFNFQYNTKKDFDSIFKIANMNSFDIKQVQRNVKIIANDLPESTRKKIQESDEHYQEDRQFLLDHSYKKIIKSDPIKNDIKIPELTNGIYHPDTLKSRFNPVDIITIPFNFICDIIGL